MRELIERFGYRFQLWQKERYGDRWGTEPTPSRNPLRFVAMVAVISLIFDTTEPFIFHRAFDVVAIGRIPVALLFIILYQLKSQWAWRLIVAWVPLGFFAYWIFRLTGYWRYQPRIHPPAVAWGFALFDIALSAAIFFWIIRVRERYFRYIQDASSAEI